MRVVVLDDARCGSTTPCFRMMILAPEAGARELGNADTAINSTVPVLPFKYAI